MTSGSRDQLSNSMLCMILDKLSIVSLLLALHLQLDQQPRASISGTSPGGHNSQAMSGQINSCTKGDASTLYSSIVVNTKNLKFILICGMLSCFKLETL